MVEKICKELELQKFYLQDNKINTIYFGGGTPSLLSDNELKSIVYTIYDNYSVAEDAEVTFETNPDDLSADYLKILRANNINRLSIGIQSFNDNFLKYLNRAHNSDAAIKCVTLAQDEGFENITIDLIYGIPSENHETFISDLNKANRLGTPHISAYCLTIEPETVFGQRVGSGKMKAPDEDLAAEQFELLLDILEKAGFEQYEISNFAKNQNYSKHNTSYWEGKEYLGIGPGAHSFNKVSRQYNVANNHKYIAAIEQGVSPATLENLTQLDKLNEYLLTSLRTKWGCDLVNLHKIYPGLNMNLFFEQVKKYEDKNLIRKTDNKLFLTQKGKLLADEITCSLLVL